MPILKEELNQLNTFLIIHHLIDSHSSILQRLLFTSSFFCWRLLQLDDALSRPTADKQSLSANLAQLFGSKPLMAFWYKKCVELSESLEKPICFNTGFMMFLDVSFEQELMYNVQLLCLTTSLGNTTGHVCHKINALAFQAWKKACNRCVRRTRDLEKHGKALLEWRKTLIRSDSNLWARSR